MRVHVCAKVIVCLPARVMVFKRVDIPCQVRTSGRQILIFACACVRAYVRVHSCTPQGIINAWTKEGLGSIDKTVEIYLKDKYREEKDALRKLCSIMQRDTFQFIAQGLQCMANDTSLHGDLRTFLPWLLNQLIGLKYEDAPDLLRMMGEMWLKKCVESGQSILDVLISVFGDGIRQTLLDLLQANPPEKSHAEVQTEEDFSQKSAADGQPMKKKEPQKKRKPLYPGAGNSKAMAYDSVIRLVHEAYEVKILADLKDEAGGRPVQPFNDFFRDFVVRKYGLKKIAMQHLGEIVACVEKNADIPHMKVFGKLAGMIDGEKWDANIPWFALSVLAKSCEIDCRPFTNISEWLNGDKEAGISEESALLAAQEAAPRCNCLLSGTELAKLKCVEKNEIGIISVHDLMMWCIEAFGNGKQAMLEGFMKVFTANDTNGDGVLEFNEFRSIVSQLVPEDTELNDRTISQLYHQVSIVISSHFPLALSLFPSCRCSSLLPVRFAFFRCALARAHTAHVNRNKRRM
jgi:hypothetical protein